MTTANVVTKERYAPYSRLEPVKKVIERIRARGLPSPMNSGVLGDLGIAEGNAYQVMQTLKFLKLVDGEGNLTDAYQQLHEASTDEYKPVLAGILRQAYNSIFEIVDPAKDDTNRINDAFRRFEPKGQRNRMTWLFLGLCRMADLAPEDTTATKRAQTVQKRAHTVQGKQQSKRQQTGETSQNGAANGTGEPADSGNNEKQMPPPPANFFWAQPAASEKPPLLDASLLATLLTKLPKSAKWTKAERDRWLEVFTANLDFTVDLVDEKAERIE
jgi:hypothetical protein